MKEKIMNLKNMNVSPKIVVIGGGTGNSILLKGLKKITDNIVTIIAMGDNGGGTGVLRKDLGMLPPGDVRACLLALSNIEPSMQKVLSYRFDKGELKGQSFGNLFLAALNGVYGSFEEAVKQSSTILNITGKVYPMTTTNVNLVAEMSDGSKIYGESEIPEIAKTRGIKIEKLSLDPENPKPMDGAIEEILSADMIILGPGSLYTSIMPNLLVSGIPEAINESSAEKIYICNVMTQDGETNDYTVKDHLEAIYKHAPKLHIDKVIVNSKIIEDKNIIDKYLIENQKQILLTDEDKKYLENKKIEIIEENIADNDEYVKHDSTKVANILLRKFIEESDTKKA